MTWLEKILSRFKKPLPPHIETGRKGEDAAAKALRKMGYRILDRNVRFRKGEIDIVAREGENLVIVEVKSLKNPLEGYRPTTRIGLKKRRKLLLAASEFQRRHRLTDVPLRFDVVSVVFRDEAPDVEVFRRVFDAQGRWT